MLADQLPIWARAAGLLVAAAVAALVRSYRSGLLATVLDDRQQQADVANNAHEKTLERIDQIYESTEATAERVESIEAETSDIARQVEHLDARMESIGEAVVELHRDDEDVDDDALRDQVGVDDLPSDITGD